MLRRVQALFFVSLVVLHHSLAFGHVHSAHPSVPAGHALRPHIHVGTCHDHRHEPDVGHERTAGGPVIGDEFDHDADAVYFPASAGGAGCVSPQTAAPVMLALCGVPTATDSQRPAFFHVSAEFAAFGCPLYLRICALRI